VQLFIHHSFIFLIPPTGIGKFSGQNKINQCPVYIGEMIEFSHKRRGKKSILSMSCDPILNLQSKIFVYYTIIRKFVFKKE